MKKQVIYVYGASGSGTSTFGRYLAKRLDYFFMDIDDYFWHPTNPPYQIKRSPLDRVERLKKDIVEHNHVVLSGSLMDWGDELIPLFTLAIRLETSTPIRLERLKKRERERFGSRLDVGGDMYETHQKFLAWAALYDEGGLNIRSKAKFEHWEKQLRCHQLLLDGNSPLEVNFEIVRSFLLQKDQERAL